MSVDGMHESCQKHERQAAKSRRRAEKRRRAKDRKRRKDVVREHGSAAYGPCARKVRYPGELAATQSALAAMRRGAPPLWVYRCCFCGGWHLTSHPRHDGSER